VPKVERMLDELSRQEVVITLLGWLGRLTKSFGGSQELTEVRLRDQVDEVADKLRAVYGDRQNGVAVSGDAGWLIADEEWVQVLLTGLLLHANMSAKQETVKVDLRRRSVVSADGEQGEVLVRYRGTPLPEDAVADIREPFRRPNSLALEPTSELGFLLGLAVANRISGLMGGQLEVEAAGAECAVRVVVPTRSTGSRIESQSAVVRAVQVAAGAAAGLAEPAESADLLGDFLVGGMAGEPAPAPASDTPVPVGAAPPLAHDGEETLGDWFPAAK
jgi:signal transduction histidine kinase